MKKKPNIKPVKAKCMIADNGKLYWYNIMPYQPNELMKKIVKEDNMRIITVLITPINKLNKRL